MGLCFRAHPMITFAVICFCLSPTVAQGLYDEPVVEILSEDTFSKGIASESLHIVQFYSPWCGHCRRYAPSWQRLADKLKAWKPHVILAAVNCEENYELCRKQHISGYPTFKYYVPFSKTGDMGQQLSMNVKEISEVDSFKKKVLDMIDKIKESNRPQWMTALNFYRGPIEREFTNNYKSVIMVVENRNSYTGRMLIMDRLNYRDRIPIYRLKAPYKGLPLYGREKFAIYIHENGNTRRMQSDSTLTKRNFIREDSPLEHQTKTSFVSSETMSTSAYQADLECGLTYMFKREVSSKQEIRGESLEILRNWLKLLLQYLPMSVPVRNSIEAINNFVEQSGEIVNGDELRDIAEVVEKNRYLPEKCYKCQGSKPYYRGYPCALWQILHTLTVKLSEKTSDGKEALEMLNTIRGYIEHFFMCRMCAKHFLERTSQTESVKTPDDLVYLIHDVHNQANQALEKTLTEDPEAPKTKFPSKELCPDCDSKEKILTFLKKFYQPDPSIAYSMYQRKSLEESPWFKLQEQQNELKQGLSQNDRAVKSPGCLFVRCH